MLGRAGGALEDAHCQDCRLPGLSIGYFFRTGADPVITDANQNPHWIFFCSRKRAVKG